MSGQAAPDCLRQYLVVGVRCQVAVIHQIHGKAGIGFCQQGVLRTRPNHGFRTGEFQAELDGQHALRGYSAGLGAVLESLYGSVALHQRGCEVMGVSSCSVARARRAICIRWIKRPIQCLCG